MGEEYSVKELYAMVFGLGSEVAALKATTTENHKQNREDIGVLKAGMQAITDGLYKLSNQFTSLSANSVKWSAFSGVITAVIAVIVTKLVEGWIK